MVIKDVRVKNIPEDRILLREIVHACVVVRDVERTARNLSERFGIGPFEVRQKSYPESQASVRGEPVEYTLKFAYAKVGPITLELVETVEGRTIYRKFLEEHGGASTTWASPHPCPSTRSWRSGRGWAYGPSR